MPPRRKTKPANHKTSSSTTSNQPNIDKHPQDSLNPSASTLHPPAIGSIPNQSAHPTEDELELPSPIDHPNGFTSADHQSRSNPTRSTTTLDIGAPHQNRNLDLTQKVARLLSQEPPPPLNPRSITNPTGPASILLPINQNHPDQIDLNHQITSLIDQQVKIFDEKLKLYQSQITQLRSELETKDQLLQELRKIRETDVEHLLENHKLVAEARFKANEKLIKAQSEELKENRQKIKDLNLKLSQVYSGEEERERLRLEQEKQELIQLNDQLKTASESQRRRRKEAEKEVQRAASVAQENSRHQLKEANHEIKTLKKMLETETENSKALISQLNQLRSGSSNSHQNNHHQLKSYNNNESGSSSHGNNSNNLNDKTIEDLKYRASIIGDFTGFEILNSTVDKKGKGNVFDCIVTDIVGRSLALNFKLQFHSDNTLSYFPSLDPERDSQTIKILPEFLRSFIRFQKEASGHVFWKLFQAFNF